MRPQNRVCALRSMRRESSGSRTQLLQPRQLHPGVGTSWGQLCSGMHRSRGGWQGISSALPLHEGFHLLWRSYSAMGWDV